MQNYDFAYSFEWAYNCPTFRETHCQIIFEARVLRNMFGPKKDKLTGDWRKLHLEKLCDLYF
jgi:hypothetical protein